MLQLTRTVGEEIIVGQDGEISITVIEIKAGRVRLGIRANRDIPIYRREVWDRIEAEKLTLEANE